MERSTPLQDHIAAEAASWFVRLEEQGDDPESRAAFVDWLLRSPEHLEEFLAVSRIWGETTGAAQLPADELIAQALDSLEPDNVVAIRSPAPREKPAAVTLPARNGSRRHRFAAAAAIAVLAIGASLWWTADSWLNPSHIRTAIGEQRSITLPDGSVLNVNTRSEIRIDFSDKQRELQLVRGEARFKVARDPTRPFVVHTPQASIRALGTVFNVRAEGERTSVAVLEGRVEVRELGRPKVKEQGAARLELRAGQVAAVDPSGQILPDMGPPLERVAAWTDRRLVFREAPLAEVAAEFNRYYRKPIRIESPELAQLRISGTFDASDPDSLIEYFERFEHVRVEQDASSIRFLQSDR